MKIFGIISFLVILISVAFFFFEKYNFDTWLEAGQKEITSHQVPTNKKPTANLPPLLINYLKKVLVKVPAGSFVTFTQTGHFRMKPNDKLSPFSAKQYASTISPMFSWIANMTLNGLSVSVCDRLINNKGELQARLFSAITVAKGSGSNFLRGELLRYLAELPWYPMAILSQPEIKWKSVSPNKITGTLSVNKVTATVEYRFDNNGLIQSIYVPNRERINGDHVDLKPWLGEFSEYEEKNGILIPVRGQVSWLLETGKFIYFDGRIDNYQISGG